MPCYRVAMSGGQAPLELVVTRPTLGAATRAAHHLAGELNPHAVRLEVRWIRYLHDDDRLHRVEAAREALLESRRGRLT